MHGPVAKMCLGDGVKCGETLFLSLKFAVIAFDSRAVSQILRKDLSKHERFNRLKGNLPQDYQSPIFK